MAAAISAGSRPKVSDIAEVKNVNYLYIKYLENISSAISASKII